jgi:ABC-type transport system involved in multi-copper enzyme maturation permease subunit
MRLFRILTFKELKGYFLTPFGWVILAFVTVMQGVSLSTAMKGFRDTPVKDSLVYVTFHTPLFWFYFLFIFPLITMRLFAEEERSGTLETLLTAPVRTWQVVLSKYAAAMLFYTVLWLPALIQFQMFVLGHRPAARLDARSDAGNLHRSHADGIRLHRGRLPRLGAHLQPDHRRASSPSACW